VEDVQAMARRYFQPERLTVATISEDEGVFQ
jgi:predicted Zn-dependent peptidase